MGPDTSDTAQHGPQAAPRWRRPGYPPLRLLRQLRPGDLLAVIENIAHILRGFRQTA
jgi:hypothetical protein